MTKSLVARSTQQRISLNGTQISESSDKNKLFEKYFSRNDSILGSDIQPSMNEGTQGKLKSSEEYVSGSPRGRKVKFSFESSNNDSDPKSIQSPFHRQLQRKNLNKTDTLVSIQPQLQDLKSMSRLDSLRNDQIQSQRQSMLQKIKNRNVNFSRKRNKDQSIYNKSFRNQARKNSNLTNKSGKIEMSQLEEHEVDDMEGISTKFSWIHKHVDFEDLDKQNIFEIYFPEFNLNEVLVKLQNNYEQRQRLKQQENKLLNQLYRSRTSKAFLNNKSYTMQKTNKGGSPKLDEELK